MSSTSSQLRELAVSESGFVFDPRSGATFTVNPVGLVVLGGLREGLGLGALVGRLRERFDAVPPEGAREDVLDFVHVLRQLGLLPVDFTL
jgi:PqqD family protein of HPr-rel-A system